MVKLKLVTWAGMIQAAQAISIQSVSRQPSGRVDQNPIAQDPKVWSMGSKGTPQIPCISEASRRSVLWMAWEAL